MSRKDRDKINRRDFVRSSTAAIAATTCLSLGVREALAAAPSLATHKANLDLIDSVMKAAVSGITEINALSRRAAAEIEQLKKTKVPEEHLSKSECDKALSIVEAVVIVVVAIVTAVFTFGVTREKLNQSLVAIAEWEADIEKQNKMTREIKAAIIKFRELVASAKDLATSRVIFAHISQDRADAAKLLEAARAKNRVAAEEMLKRYVPGSSVIVQEVKEENGFLMSLRVGNFSYCISTTSQCGGKSFTLAR